MPRSRPRWARRSPKQGYQSRKRIASNRRGGWENEEADSTILISSVPAARVRSRTAKVADTASSNASRVSDLRTSEETRSDENRSPVPDGHIASFGLLSRQTEEPSIATVSTQSSGVSASCAPVTTTVDGGFTGFWPCQTSPLPAMLISTWRHKASSLTLPSVGLLSCGVPSCTAEMC
jgi:hypothetical protein